MGIVWLVFFLMIVLIFLLPLRGDVGKKTSPAAFFGLFLIALVVLIYFLNR